MCGSPAQMNFENGIFLSRISGNGCGHLSRSRATCGKICLEFHFLLETSGCAHGEEKSTLALSKSFIVLLQILEKTTFESIMEYPGCKDSQRFQLPSLHRS